MMMMMMMIASMMMMMMMMMIASPGWPKCNLRLNLSLNAEALFIIQLILFNLKCLCSFS